MFLIIDELFTEVNILIKTRYPLLRGISKSKTLYKMCFCGRYILRRADYNPPCGRYIPAPCKESGTVTCDVRLANFILMYLSDNVNKFATSGDQD